MRYNRSMVEALGLVINVENPIVKEVENKTSLPEPHVVADSIAVLSRETNPAIYVRNLLEIDEALRPVENLEWESAQRTRENMRGAFEMKEETFNRHIRFLQKGFVEAFPKAVHSPFAFTKLKVMLQNHPRYSHQNVDIFSSDQGIRILMLELLSRGHRSATLQQRALQAWQEDAHPIIKLLYQYKTIEEYTTTMHHGYNTTIARLNTLFPNWRETFPTKQHVFEAVLLSPSVMTSLHEFKVISKKRSGRPKGFASASRSQSQKNPNHKAHVEIGVTYITKNGYALTPENIQRVQKHLHKKMKIDYPIQTIAAMFAIARKKNIHATPSHSQYASTPAQPLPVEYKSR
jgi:hypothetical protein